MQFSDGSKQIRFSILAAFIAVSLVACSNDVRNLDKYTDKRTWQQVRFFTHHFVLTGLLKTDGATGNKLTVYIKGDGLAWLSETEISSDPTPRDPVAMELAYRHPASPVLYLARPCQYVTSTTYGRCHPRFWTTYAFAPEVVDSMNEAIENAKRRVGAQNVVLVGYSGGGTVAALVAARRSDIVLLVSVAANLDHRTWTTTERLTPLGGSLNPVDFIPALSRIPQFHFVGRKDEVVPPLAVYAYRDRFPPDRKPPVRTLTDFDHRCCWIDSWRSLITPLLRRIPPPSQ